MAYQPVQAQVVYQVVQTGLVLGQRVVVVEAIHLHLVQIELVTGEYAAKIDILG